MSSMMMMKSSEETSTQLPQELRELFVLLVNPVVADFDIAVWMVKHFPFRQVLKIIDLEPWVAWRWNAETGLWEKAARQYVEFVCISTFADFFARIVNSSDFKNFEDKQQEAFENKRRRLLSASGAACITKLMFPVLCDPSFASRLDSLDHIIPLKGGQVIDLIQNVIRPRTPEDLFSMEFECEYNPNADMKPTVELMSDVCLGREDLIEYSTCAQM